MGAFNKLMNSNAEIDCMTAPQPISSQVLLFFRAAYGLGSQGTFSGR